MIAENLRQLGLNDKEIRVYLSLISLGPSPAGIIAKQAGVNRGTTYDILKNLIRLGLTAYYKRYHGDEKRQHFVAEPPRKLLDAVDNKRRGLEALKQQIKSSLPELESLYEKSGAKPVVRYYESDEGVRSILADVIQTMKAHAERVYYVYSSADIRKYLYKAYRNFNRDRLAGKISVKAIAIGRGGELAGLDERKWLSRKESAPTYVLIYGGKVGMVTLDAAARPVGVVIENEGLYRTQALIFKTMWETL